MTVTKRKRGGQWLLAEGVTPRQYSFKAEPDLDDDLIRAQADLEAYDIRASKAGILRFLVKQHIPNAVELIRNHFEEK